MESSIGGKPTLAPKPRLTPKPFSLQKNTTFRSINAPKTVTATSKTTPQQAGKSKATSVPKPTLPTPAQQSTTPDSKPSTVSVLTKDQPKPTKESKVSPHGEDTLDSSVGKSDPAPQTTPLKETPKSIQRDDVIQTNHKAPTDIVTNSEQKDGKKKEDEISVVQKPEESGSEVSSSPNPTYRRASTRNRLSVELTSKFESGGLSLPPQPNISISTTSTKEEANKPESSAPERSLTTSEPSNRESDEVGLKEDYDGGGSIKRRISLLFDSSSKPEVPTKREEPEMINGTGGVKARIKNWATETSSEGPKVEKKPQVVLRTRSKSEPVTAAAAEKTPKTPPVKPPAAGTSSSQAVGDLVSKVSPAEQRTETPLKTTKDAPTGDKSSESPSKTSGEHIQNKSTESDVQLRKRSLSAGHTVTDEGDSASESGEHGLKRDNVKRRSVRFGVVERDDGGPPVVLGSPSDSSEEEDEEEEEKGEDASEDGAEEDAAISVPVYRRVLEKKDDEVQRLEAEQLKHLEFEKKRRAEEIELVRLKLEEERKLKEEEEEREKQKKARQREAEEKERERLKKEEIKRQREEWERERLKEDERERERQKEEEMERERQMELMWQRQREEERERARQKEERLKQDQEEREKERLKEEERLREEGERQRLREEEERAIHEHKGHRVEAKLRVEELNKEKQREKEWEKEWVKKAGRLEGEDREREKEVELMWQRQKEEDREKARQKEERLKQEEREKERIREEAEERERHRKLREQQEREDERIRQIEMEKQREEKRREEERKEEERKRQIEKERVEEMERMRRIEMEERLRMEEKRGRDLLTNTEVESSVDEPNLISFDSEDVPPESPSPYSPIAKTYKPEESLIEVVYDDFSVKPPLIKVDFDDFSVKPKRWGSQAKVETSPVIDNWAAEPVDKDESEVLVPLYFSPWENKVPEQVEKPESPEPILSQESPEEEKEKEEKEEQEPKEEQLIFMEVEEEEKETEREQEDETQEEEVKEEDDMQETQVNNYCKNGEDKDTDALLDTEPDQQNEACEQTPEIDSPKPVPDQVTEVSTEDLDTTDFHIVAELFPFPESSTPLLDSSIQKSKADLGKRRSRSRPSRSLRAGLGPSTSTDWRTCDSTDEKQRESDSEEEQPKSKIVCSPPPTSQKVPIFPGLSPTALIAQLKKRTGGGGTGGAGESEKHKRREENESREEVAPSPSQPSRSPRSAPHLAGAARVLPPIGGSDGGAASSPAWLKELKSKKRLSQYDAET
ncbi:182 kDa tankyrase-1-binding protein [Larimichthys crocea]|uniref:182 kDa tankyrase-1-binding protein n=1 Tax=Larimichthys crocea TaxID=215358 RepID=UPI000F5E1C01|nr:calponin homology domain-containing protein DDB_G0272472 [Larimichthys crocea]XP_027135177.1 calponin homology domain-containing protein DDB_G0272472 [Larimichthys crocea]